jgi:hypothetical protein
VREEDGHYFLRAPLTQQALYAAIHDLGRDVTREHPSRGRAGPHDAKLTAIAMPTFTFEN